MTQNNIDIQNVEYVFSCIITIVGSNSELYFDFGIGRQICKARMRQGVDV